MAADDPCMIMYTSGTTGQPKGAVLSHANITWNSLNVLVDTDLASDEITLVTAPLFHTAALNMTCLPTLLKGGRVVIEPGFDAERMLDLIESQGVTCLFGVPTMFAAVAESPRWGTADLSSVRTLMCGGSPVPKALIDVYLRRGLSFIQGYGMTEASPGTLLLDREMSAVKAGSAGVPHFFTDVRLVGPDGQPVEIGNPGEVHVAGPNVSTGYWRRPEEAHTTFAGGWLRTGDIAVLDKDGYAYIIDRVKDMYISGGENVYPAEVEQLLHGHPAVADCAVIGVPDEKWGEVGKALIVPAADVESDPRVVLDFLASRLARYKVPRSVEFVDALPRNASGKILKSQLRAGLDRGPVRRADQGAAQGLDTGAP
jgi:fatty-acyl-CoA synthase